MFDVSISHNPPADDLGSNWPTRYAIMAELTREFWGEGDLLVTARINGSIVGLAHISRRETVDRLESLVSIFPHAGKLLLGRSIAIARHDGVKLSLVSLPESEGFYRHCKALHEERRACFVSK